MKKKLISAIIVILILCGSVYGLLEYRQTHNETLTTILESDLYPSIEEKISSMTLEEKVGQMFMGCFYSDTPSPETVAKYNLGSVLLFHSSFIYSDKESIKASLDAIDAACDIKPMIAVDEEGGTVTRVSSFPAFRNEPFRSPRSAYDAGGMDAVIADVHEKNALLSEIGIDLNLAPVCDISQNPNDFMYSRSLGQNAKTTAKYAEKVTKACLEDNIGCSLKHFPGYGNSADTHNGSSIDNRSIKQLQNQDLLPFKAGIAAGVPSILVSHNIVSSLDPKLPASLSPAVHHLLRYDLGFDGVIITDDLSMGAVTGSSSISDSAVMAIMAGNDMLCTGNYAQQQSAVVSAVKNGLISEERIDNSVRRILTWKKAMSLF